MNYLSHEVSHLKLDLSDLSSALSSRLASLESKFTSVSEEVASLRPVVNSAAPHVTAHSIPGTSSPQSSLFRSPRHPKVPSPENRKFNLIVSGVPEAPEGQARLSRVNHDFECVSSIFSELFDTANGPPIQIRDCRHLGRFRSGSKGSRSRLVLVTLDSVLAVDRLLSRTASAGSKSIRIRRDLSPKAQSAHTLLLKERRNLIESGVEHSDIALQRMSLLVKGRVYGTIRGDTFKLAGASTSPLVTAPFPCSSVPVSTSSSPLVNAPFSSSYNSESSALPSSEIAPTSAVSNPAL